ncbi:MAG: CDP-alcohol phosphatidyltransferase family protein [Acidobacteriia bacterium]|nr:CDP-alcohol phosphatidyltransferase family protein [Terriglobia bacterium]
MSNVNTFSSSTSRQGFRNAVRVQQSLLATVEKPCLVWLARRMPAWVKPDHLTALGFAAMILAGASYALARWWPPSLLVVNVWLALNWFGDSLDGTLARERQCQRPRYGFYVDHIIDSFGALFLAGGLALSGYMTWWVATGLLLSFYLLSINAYLATYTLGTFHLSYWKFSPTEIRILLAVGNAVALLHPTVHLFTTQQRFFDVAGAVAILSMGAVLAVSVARNTIALYRMERLQCAG